MAAKSHFCEAMLSMAARCLTASSSPSNQVTSTLKSLPQYSAACLPWAHQVACKPAFEKAALSVLSDRPVAAAKAGLTASPPMSAVAAPAETAAVRKKSRRDCGDKVLSSGIAFLPVIETVSVRDADGGSHGRLWHTHAKDT